MTTKNQNAISAFSSASLPFSAAALAKPRTDNDRGYASRLQFISTGSSKLVTAGQVKIGSYALVNGEKVVDLGKEILVVPLGRLDKAIDFSSGDETIVAFGEGTPEYDKIKAEVVKDGFDSGCMYGPVFLCYEVSSAQFVELFLNNVSGRNEAENINEFLPISVEASDAHFAATGERVNARAPRAAKLGSKEVTSKRGKKTYIYNVPTTAEGGPLNVSTPPTTERLQAAFASFFKQAEPKEAETRDR